MSNEYESSSFCRSCVGKAEIKIMCPLIGSLCGFGCVSLSHCKHCAYHRGVDLEESKVLCGHGRGSSEFMASIKSEED